MTNEEILDIVGRCDLAEGEELVPDEAYLYNRKFRVQVSGVSRYMQTEIIVLVRNGIKVGGIYRMGSFDIHCVIDPRHRGQHIMSDFFRTGIIQSIWAENRSVDLCGVDTRDEYNKKKHLANLCGLAIRNENEIERHLAFFRE